MNLFLSGVVAGRRQHWPLDQPVLEIGRSSRCAIQIADGTVSKNHAEISRAGDGWQIRDLGSRNGTRVNGVPVTDPKGIQPGDQIEIGHVPMEVTTEADPTPTVFSEGLDLASSIRIPADRILLSRSTARLPAETKLMTLLSQAGQLLILPRPMKETCDEILKVVEQAVPATRLIILLRDKEGDEPVQVAARHLGGNATEPLALSKTIMEMVLSENTAIVTRDAASDPRFMSQQSIVLQGVHSAMAVPLFDNERVLGLLYADSVDPRTSYNQEHLEVLTLVANMAAVKITNARLLDAEQSRLRMAQELATAAAIQRGLLPAHPPEVAGYRFHARLESCYEVGGDLFDFHRSPDGSICFVVGDVSGKGMGAALLMSSFLSSSRVLFDVCTSLDDMINRLNTVMFQGSDPSHFITVFVGRLNPATGHLKFVNAGHPPPYAMGPSGVRTLDTTGIPVGMLESFPFTVGEITLEPGDLLAVFTDGIPEARRGEEFYEDERFLAELEAIQAQDDLELMGKELIHQVDNFLAGEARSDDITLLLVRRDGTQGA